MDLSIVIPVKNEADNILPLAGEIRAALDGLIAYEILYVDDGSDDATASEISRLAGTFPQGRLVGHTRNYGQSAAISTGVHAARGAWVATLDGDGQNDPADLPSMWHLARQAPPSPPLLIAGYRQKRRDSWSKRVASRIANAIRGRLLADPTP